MPETVQLPKLIESLGKDTKHLTILKIEDDEDGDFFCTVRTKFLKDMFELEDDEYDLLFMWDEETSTLCISFRLVTECPATYYGWALDALNEIASETPSFLGRTFIYLPEEGEPPVITLLGAMTLEIPSACADVNEQVYLARLVRTMLDTFCPQTFKVALELDARYEKAQIH